MKFKLTTLSIFSLYITAQLFIGCSTIGLSTRHMPDKTSLSQRVTALWDARVKKDWATVFEMTDAAYQKTESKTKFIVKGGLKEVLDFTIDNITISNDNSAMPTATVMMRFTIFKAGYKFKPVIQELWLFEPNNGWVLNKTAMKNKKPL
ncbi:hypothetical protein [uncultured Desulfobacter sp.]|uniref:hypothetical protein n=1 Tax=uncultured Desulfobacter sp. TaxID=240139 RepID=UPI002AABCF1E|nr:hypothetical protein [uncultured Desulfobacter sp.]